MGTGEGLGQKDHVSSGVRRLPGHYLRFSPQCAGGSSWAPRPGATDRLVLQRRAKAGQHCSQLPVRPCPPSPPAPLVLLPLGCLLTFSFLCRALRQNGREAPDPYVSLLLLPDKNRGTKRKTSQKKRTLNPEFNERSFSRHSGGEKGGSGRNPFP